MPIGHILFVISRKVEIATGAYLGVAGPSLGKQMPRDVLRKRGKASSMPRIRRHVSACQHVLKATANHPNASG